MEKIKSTIYLDENLIKEINNAVESGDYKSRNEFYIKAIENQITADILGRDLVSEKVANAIDKQTENLAKRISRGMFRYAVDIEMIMHMHAAILNLSNETISDLRGISIKHVKETQGKISLEAISEFQNDRATERIYDEWDE